MFSYEANMADSNVSSATAWDPVPSSDCMVSVIISGYTLVVSGAGRDNIGTKCPTQNQWCSVAAENMDAFDVDIVRRA